MHNIFRAGQGAGASGAFFFFTKDQKYIIKTMRGSERDNLLSMLSDLIRHFSQYPNSLITKIYGLFTIKTQKFAPVDIIIMENTTKSMKK